MNQSNLRPYGKPLGFVAVGLLAGIVMAGAVTASAAEDTGSTGGTTTGSESSTGKPPCPDEPRGGIASDRAGDRSATAPSPSAVPSSFQFA